MNAGFGPDVSKLYIQNSFESYRRNLARSALYENMGICLTWVDLAKLNELWQVRRFNY